MSFLLVETTEKSKRNNGSIKRVLNAYYAKFYFSITSTILTPPNPAEATLDVRTGWGTRILWLAALVMLIVALAIIIFLLDA